MACLSESYFTVRDRMTIRIPPLHCPAHANAVSFKDGTRERVPERRNTVQARVYCQRIRDLKKTIFQSPRSLNQKRYAKSHNAR